MIKNKCVSFQLSSHRYKFSADPCLDGSNRNPEVFGDLLVRPPVDDRQQQASAMLWVQLIEHSPQRHRVRDAGRWVRSSLLPLADGVQCVVFEGEFALGVLPHL